MLIICDFDGTVTARDTNAALARRFSPDAAVALEGLLVRREMSLRDVLSAEFEAITDGLEAVVDAALEIPFRAGFGELLDAADARGDQVVLLSSGFRELIEPMLARDGFAARVPLIANRIELNETGGSITWRDLPGCARCGEPCKRHDVAELRAQHDDHDSVVFVGDGFSDRCGAETADRIFARDSLAAYLDAEAVEYERWDDFHDIAVALGLRSGETA